MPLGRRARPPAVWLRGTCRSRGHGCGRFRDANRFSDRFFGANNAFVPKVSRHHESADRRHGEHPDIVHAIEARYDDGLVVPGLPVGVRYSIYAATFYLTALFGNFGTEGLQADNLDDDLRSRGFTVANKTKRLIDINPSFGGPIARDKVWFHAAFRYSLTDNYVGGLYYNKTPAAWDQRQSSVRPG